MRNKKLFCLLTINAALFLSCSNLNDYWHTTNFTQISIVSESSNLKVKPIKFNTLYKPVDPYYTGASKVKAGFSSDYVYQNISMDYIGKIENVWDQYKGDGVTIAVIDTGLDIDHPDFNAPGKVLDTSAYFTTNIATGNVNKLIGKNYLKHSWNESEGSYSAHGTNTAGAALADDNEVGTVGVAPNAKLLAIKTDLYDSSINEAIKYAADNGAKIISMSFGGHAAPYTDADGKYHGTAGTDYFPGSDKSMVTALNYANSKGCILIASAGNENTEGLSYPAANDYVIGVGALERYSENKRSFFSNFNPSDSTALTNNNVDIVAPGYVVTPDYSGPKTSPQSTYCQTQGTSFSCPIVAGAAALWIQKHPEGTPEQFKTALYTSAKDIGDEGWDKEFGYGSLDVGKLLELDDPTIKLDKRSILLKRGQTDKLTVTIEGSSSPVFFSSSDPKIVEVDDEGNITAKEIGIAIINVTCGISTVKCVVTVSSSFNPLIDGFGCQGNIATPSFLLTTVSALFLSILLIKKKKED